MEFPSGFCRLTVIIPQHLTLIGIQKRLKMRDDGRNEFSRSMEHILRGDGEDDQDGQMEC